MSERTAYDRYLRAAELHALQAPVSDTEGELSFLVVCQVQELWFGLLGADLRTARDHLAADRVAAATLTLRRAASHFGGLNASWDSLTWMTPGDFRPIKEGMTATHGRSSSLQSWKYRELTYLLGLKDAALAEPVAATPEHAALQAALDAPSVYDAVLGVLHRRGLAVPAEYAKPGAAQPAGGHREARPEVEEAWGVVYAGAPEHADLRELATALFALAEGFADYRHRHLLATRRTLGRRPAYYGTSGVDWLLAGIHEMPFPELWTLHTGDG